MVMYFPARNSIIMIYIYGAGNIKMHFYPGTYKMNCSRGFSYSYIQVLFISCPHASTLATVRKALSNPPSYLH